MKTSLKVMLGFAAGYAVGSIIMKLIDNRTMEQKIQDAVEEELAKLELNKKEIDECDEQNEITEEHSDEAVVENENENENENKNENDYIQEDSEEEQYDELTEMYKRNIDKCVSKYVIKNLYDRDEDDSDTDVMIDMMAEMESMTKQQEQYYIPVDYAKEANNPYGKPATVPVILPPDVGEKLEDQAAKDGLYDVVEFLYFDGDNVMIGSEGDILTKEDIKSYLGFVVPKKLTTLPEDDILYVKNDRLKLIIEVHTTKEAYVDQRYY